jgi:monothiol glutaredoxin
MTDESGIHKFIQDEICSNDIVVFMKGTPDFPMCGFSGRVVQILNHFKRPFKGINVLEDENLRQGIKTFASWPTIPQIYVKGEFVGGCDIAMEMAQSGELEQLFNNKLGPAGK